MPVRPATIRLSFIGRPANAITANADTSAARDRRIRAEVRRDERNEAQRHGELERPRRGNRGCRRNSRRGSSVCHDDQSANPPPRKNRPPARGSPPASKRRTDAANAWSVSRNARPCLPARRQRAQVGRHRGAVDQKAQSRHEACQHDDGERRAGRQQLHGENLRCTGEYDRRQSECTERRRARCGCADAAYEAERHRADAHRQHGRETRAEVAIGSEPTHRVVVRPLALFGRRCGEGHVRRTGLLVRRHERRRRLAGGTE